MQGQGLPANAECRVCPLHGPIFCQSQPTARLFPATSRWRHLQKILTAALHLSYAKGLTALFRAQNLHVQADSSGSKPKVRHEPFVLDSASGNCFFWLHPALCVCHGLLASPLFYVFERLRRFCANCLLRKLTRSRRRVRKYLPVVRKRDFKGHAYH